jgi:hypothetical protein
MCTFGVAPGSLVILPINRVMTSSQPAATIMDFVPLENVMPFGMCMSPANPEVAAATAAAMGVLTPMPCIPMTVAPWAPGAATVMEAGIPVLDSVSMLMCIWGGEISITEAGQFTENVP